MKEEGVLQGQVGAFGEGSFGSGDSWCGWYGGLFSEYIRGRLGGAVWGVSIEGVEGVVEYFQELFRVWVVFFDLGVNGDWMRVWWWCVL